MYNETPSLGSVAWSSQQQQPASAPPAQPNPGINLDDLFGGPVAPSSGFTAPISAPYVQPHPYQGPNSTLHAPSATNNLSASPSYITNITHPSAVPATMLRQDVPSPFNLTPPSAASTAIIQPSYAEMTSLPYDQSAQQQQVIQHQPYLQPQSQAQPMLHQQQTIPLPASVQGFNYTGTPAVSSYNNFITPSSALPNAATLTFASALPTAASSPLHAQPDDDRAQLEKIRRLRRELEEEQQREQKKREEMQTWGCDGCTFRNPLNTITCEMCGTSRKGFAAQAASLNTSATCANVLPLPTNSAVPTVATPAAIQQNSSTHAFGGCVHWSCSMCKTVNSITLNRCSACSAFRHTGTPVSVAQKDGVPNQSSNSYNSDRNNDKNNNLPHANSSFGSANGIETSPGMACNVNWKCGMCSKLNLAQNANCTDCNAYRRNGIPEPHAANTNTTYRTAYPSSLPAAPAAGSRECLAANATSAVLSQMPTQSSSSYPACMQPPPQQLSWQCSVCTLENSVQQAVCSACQSGQRPRHLNPTANSKTASNSGGDAYRPQRRHHNSSTTSHTHSSSPEVAATGQREWPCPTCTFVNPLGRAKCDMCGAARPESFGLPTVLRDRNGKETNELSEEDEIQWQEDVVAKSCNRCHQDFGLMRRRHHCRACGYVFCATCSPFKAPLKKNGDAERLCASCYEARETS